MSHNTIQEGKMAIPLRQLKKSGLFFWINLLRECIHVSYLNVVNPINVVWVVIFTESRKKSVTTSLTPPHRFSLVHLPTHPPTS